MKKALTGILLMALLATACITVVTPAPVSPPPAASPPPATATDTQPANPPQSVPAAFNLPTVAVFAVQPANIMSGDYATLIWDIRNTFDVTIEPGLAIIRPSGSQPVNPPFTTTYKLTAINSQGSILVTTTLTVSGAPPGIDTPVVKFFNANPYVIRKGEASTLSWQTVSGSSVSIDKGVGTVPGEGTAQVTPEVTTTYMLTVTSPDGAQFQTVTVNVK